MKKHLFNIFTGVLLLTLHSCATKHPTPAQPADYVNPYMGNISHLLVPTYPTVHLPNSLLRIYPERTDFTSDKVKGLPLVVTSHRGSSAFNLSFYQGKKEGLKPVYYYTYDNESIKPYCYTSYFEEEEVEASLVPNHQSAIYELKFEKMRILTLYYIQKTDNCLPATTTSAVIRI